MLRNELPGVLYCVQASDDTIGQPQPLKQCMPAAPPTTSTIGEAHHRCLSGYVLGQGIGQSGHVSGQVFYLTSVGQGAGQGAGHMRT